MSHGSLPRSRRCADGLRASAARSRSRRDTTLLIAAPRAAPHQPPAFVAANRSQFVSPKTRSHTSLPGQQPPLPFPCPAPASPAPQPAALGHTWAAAVGTLGPRLWPRPRGGLPGSRRRCGPRMSVYQRRGGHREHECPCTTSLRRCGQQFAPLRAPNIAVATATRPTSPSPARQRSGRFSSPLSRGSRPILYRVTCPARQVLLIFPAATAAACLALALPDFRRSPPPPPPAPRPAVVWPRARAGVAAHACAVA